MKIWRYGILCFNGCKREMRYYKHKGEAVGHLLCSSCNCLKPIEHKEYVRLSDLCLDLNALDVDDEETIRKI